MVRLATRKAANSYRNRSRNQDWSTGVGPPQMSSEMYYEEPITEARMHYFNVISQPNVHSAHVKDINRLQTKVHPGTRLFTHRLNLIEFI